MKTLLLAIILLQWACADLEAAKQGRLVGTEPEDGATEIYLDSTFTIVFTEKYVLESLTSQAESGPCQNAMTVKISPDNFINCIGGTIIEASDGSGRRVIFTPISELPAQTDLQMLLSKEIRFVEHNNLGETVVKYKTGTETSPQQ